jgi:hypothetical protein
MLWTHRLTLSFQYSVLNELLSENRNLGLICPK